MTHPNPAPDPCRCAGPLYLCPPCRADTAAEARHYRSNGWARAPHPAEA